MRISIILLLLFLVSCNQKTAFEKVVFLDDAENEISHFEDVSIIKGSLDNELIFVFSENDHKKLEELTKKLAGTKIILKSDQRTWSVQVVQAIENGIISIDIGDTGTIYHSREAADKALLDAIEGK